MEGVDRFLRIVWGRVWWLCRGEMEISGIHGSGLMYLLFSSRISVVEVLWKWVEVEGGVGFVYGVSFM